MAPEWEVLAVRFGRHTMRRSAFFLHYAGYGELDDVLQMDYYLWVIRGSSGTVVVDTGFAPDVGRRRCREVLRDPIVALADLGIDAADVRTVIVTHAHYDHIGNLDRFPRAEVVMSRREFDFWQGPLACRAHFAIPSEEPELAHLAEVRRQGRLKLVGPRHELHPGIELIEVGGHTPGQLIVVVRSATGNTVLASDAIHSYEEFEHDRPFAIVHDVAAMYQAFDRIAAIAAEPRTSVVAGHDPAVMDRFTAHPELPDSVVQII